MVNVEGKNKKQKTQQKTPKQTKKYHFFFFFFSTLKIRDDTHPCPNPNN